MSEVPVVLFGLGFTATRLADRLLRKGRCVFAVTRNPARFSELASRGLLLSDFDPELVPRGAVVAHTIPPVEPTSQARLQDCLAAMEPRRVVYVSATSVYGDLGEVAADSPVVPVGDSSIRRYQDELWIANGPWESLILRAAAIYGPGRGAHRRLAVPGAPPLNQRRGPSGMVSRIHVDDLATLVEAGLDASLCGSFPVADELPCSTETILRWCVDYLGLDPNAVDISGTISSGRRVDGRDIARQLGVELQYPDYRSGVAQCIREEGWA